MPVARSIHSIKRRPDNAPIKAAVRADELLENGDLGGYIFCMDRLIASVVQVGCGRGFIVESRDASEQWIITAAHCLPKLPPAHPGSYTEERTYENLIGTLDGERTVWAECLSADPVADIAVLTGPDDQVYFDACLSG